ncbi:MAG: tetratricopeptide repeat protein [Magnetovibrio sp.]|nr:tetratricopeptide repeat protein [Magnetovibrio sp.]
MAKSSRNPNETFKRAVAALQSGDLAKAAREARKLSKQAPDAADAWNLRGTVAQQARASADAAKFFRRALQIRPGDPGVLNNLGGALLETGDPDAAIDAYRQSLDARPDSTDTRMNLGNALTEARRFAEAETEFRAVVEAKPDEHGAWLNLGGALIGLRRYADALEAFEQLVAQGVNTKEVHNNLYNVLVALGRIDAAEAALQDLLALAGDDPKILVNVSVLHFLRERWPAAWESYAKRWQWQPDEARPFAPPWWNGEDLAGRKILVWGEQGLGDEVMFAGMIPDLLDAGAHVVCECDARLVALLQRSFPEIECLPQRVPPVAEAVAAGIDFQTPSGNLGIWYRQREDQFRGGAPYLKADAERARALRQAYGGDQGELLVGVTWRSLNPDIGDMKSMALDDLEPVLRVPGVRFLDLQYGDTADELAAFAQRTGIRIHHDDAIDPMTDIDGHAAQIAAMDLVISISNTTVHMAGALGMPTWCLLKMIPNRCWLLDREDSPFYGSVRLFRQSEPMNWRPPVEAAAGALAKRVEGATA